jgi:hypothetical protein
VKESIVSGERTSLVNARATCSGVWDQPNFPPDREVNPRCRQLEQFAETIRTSQQAVVGAVEAWSKSLQSAFSSPGLSTASAVDPNQIIDQVFDFAEKMLEVQREFAKNLASPAAAARETTRQQADAAMKTVQDQTK